MTPVIIFIAFVGAILAFGQPADPHPFSDEATAHHIQWDASHSPVDISSSYHKADKIDAVLPGRAVEPHKIQVEEPPAPRLFEIPMGGGHEARLRAECANGKVSACDGIRVRRLP